MVFLAYIFMARRYERHPRGIYSLLYRPLASTWTSADVDTRTSLSLCTHHRAKAVYEAAINLSVYVRTVLKLKEAASCNQRCSRRATFTDDRAYEEPGRIYKYESVFAKSVMAYQSFFLFWNFSLLIKTITISSCIIFLPKWNKKSIYQSFPLYN